VKRATLAQLGEAGLLRLLTGRWPQKSRAVAVGIGDDCAVLRFGKRQLLFKTDIVAR